MKCKEVVAYKHRLDGLFDQVRALDDDLELRAHWAKYLCVLACGFLEVALREIYAEYTSLRSDPTVTRCVRKRLDGVNNPNMSKIVEVAGWFSSEWARQLEEASAEVHKGAIDSIIANRHLIVHGRSVGVTYVRIREWYKSAVAVIEMIEGQCGL